MKKLFSTLGMMAMVSLCLFTSCKDEDVAANANVVIPTFSQADLTAAETAADVTANTQAATDANAAVVATGATKTGETTDAAGVTTTTYDNGTTVVADPENNKVTTTEADGTTTEVTVETEYSYEVDGVTYKTMDEVMAALRNKPAGTVATIVTTLTQITTTTKKDKNGNVIGTPEKKTENKQATSKIEIPQPGQTKQDEIKIPTSVKTDTTAPVPVTVKTEKGGHSGGNGGNK